MGIEVLMVDLMGIIKRLASWDFSTGFEGAALLSQCLRHCRN